MKSSVIKMILPVAAFVLASAGAVGTANKESDSGLTGAQGWRRDAPKVCAPEKQCNNISVTLCYNGANQMFSKPTPTSDCTGILYHQ